MSALAAIGGHGVTAEPQSPPPEGRPAATGIERARDVGSVVTGTHGPVFVGGTVWYAENRRERRGALALDPDHEQTLEAVFVPPPGWRDAMRIFGGDGVVLLAGEPGIGRRTAGWRLLGSVRDENSRAVQVLRPEPAFGRFLDTEDVVERDRLLLDLSEIDDQEFERVQDELAGFFSVLVEHEAVLVVLLPAGVRRPWPEFRRRTATLGRPDGREVLDLHLRKYGIQMPPLLPTGIDDVLKRRNVRDIADLAFLAREACSVDAEGDSATWLSKALVEISDRGAEISSLVSEHPTAAERALLLAVALFDGADCETIVAAERRLLESVRHTVEPVPEFERAGLGVRVTDLGGRISVDGRVAFAAVDHAAAVLAYFWTHFPGQRDGFTEWVIRCGAIASAEAVRLEAMVARFVTQCFAVGRLADVVSAIRRWAADGRFPSVLASAALEYGLTSRDHGWAFRRQCYDWATAPRSGRAAIGLPLADLIVSACRTVMAESHPEQAIVRLRHLTRYPDRRVALKAVEALAGVVGSDRGRMRYLLMRLTGGRMSDAESRAADADLFLRIIAPESLVARPASGRSLVMDEWVQSRLVERWRDVLVRCPPEMYEPAMHRWLSGHAEARPEEADAMVAVLVAACGSRFDLLVVLHTVSREWARTWLTGRRPWGRQTIDRLYAAVDAAAVVATDVAVTPSPSTEDA